MSLQEFVPTPRFEDYQEAFKDFYRWSGARTASCSSRRTRWAAPSSSACRTTARSARCSRTVGADPENELLILTGSGEEFM